MTNKRYYWLKLKEDFFRQKEIKKLRRIAGGDTFTIIYLKMLLKSLKNDGRLYYDGIEDDFVSELALDIDEDEGNVKMTVAYLASNGILIQNNAEEYEILTAKEMTGSECDSAQRVRKMRLQKSQEELNKTLQSNAQMLLSNTDVTNSNTEIDIDKRVKSKSINCADARTAKTSNPDDPDFWKFAKENAEMAEVFHHETGLTPVKSQFGLWINSLRDLAEAGITVERMKKTINFMKSEGTPIYSPSSLLKTAQMLKARGSVPASKQPQQDRWDAASERLNAMMSSYTLDFVPQEHESEVIDI